jgi:hypothetical protein
MTDQSTPTDLELKKEEDESKMEASELDPDIGDLSMLDDANDSASHQIGDLSSLDDDDDLIGDLSLLDEAIAELDSKVESDSSAADASALSDGDVPTVPAGDDDVPILSEAVAEMQAGHTMPAANTSDTVPLLGDSAIISASSGGEDFGEDVSMPVMAEDESFQSSGAASKTAPELSDFGSDAATTELNLAEELLTEDKTEDKSDEDEIGSMFDNMSTAEAGDSSLSLLDEEPAAEETSETVPDFDLDESEVASNLASNVTTAGGSEISTDDSIFDNSLFESVESGEETPATEAAATEPAATQATEAASGLELPESQITATKVDADDSIFDNSLFETKIEGESEEKAAPEEAASAAASAFAASATSSAIAASAISSDLHAHLTHRIDQIVTEALGALSKELNDHLTARMEKLVMESVDDALPGLMESFSNGLRSQVQSQIRKELPKIVNEMLGDVKFEETAT